MSKKRKIEVRVALTDELAKQFLAIKKATCLRSKTEVLRYCVAQEHARIYIKYKPSEKHKP